MPELAEVEFYRKKWDAGIGEKVVHVRWNTKARIFRDSDTDELNYLEGRKLLKSEAQAKLILFTFSENLRLLVHLGMTGKLLTGPVELNPAKHEHLVIYTSERALVFSDYRMFGKASLHFAIPNVWQDLPPPILSRKYTRFRLQQILKKHPRKPLKSLLLEQNYFPGIGNWMADEILWRSEIHPMQTSKYLSDTQTDILFRHTKTVCKNAMQVIGKNWGTPPDTWLFNHRWKKGGICPRTGTSLEYIKVNGRTSCFSPDIQQLIE